MNIFPVFFFKVSIFFGRMGDAAKVQRREQIKRWNGSSTDKQPAAPRRRWRDEEEDGREDGERVQDSDVHRPGRQHVKRR